MRLPRACLPPSALLLLALGLALPAAQAFLHAAPPSTTAAAPAAASAVPRLQRLEGRPAASTTTSSSSRRRQRLELLPLEAAAAGGGGGGGSKGFGKGPKKGGDGEDKDKKKKAEAATPKTSGVGKVVRPGAATPQGPPPVPKEIPRKFQMLYTCNICEGRNIITVDRIAFTEGIVVARCKHCDAKHLVADNLSKLDFGKGKVTLDDLLALRGEKAGFVDLSQNPDLSKYDLQYKEDGTVELMPKDE